MVSQGVDQYSSIYALCSRAKKLVTSTFSILLIIAPQLLADDDVFLKQTTDRNSVFVGEQVVNTFELYTRVPLVNPQFIDLAYDGFWQESFSEDQHSATEVRGRYYNVIKIRRALFALTPGRKILPVRQIKASTIVLRQLPPIEDFDPFDQRFMQRFFGEEEYRERLFRSNTLELEVKALPPPGSPLPVWPGSLGLVGSTSVHINAPSSAVRAGETKTITVEVSSLGDISKLQAPPIAADAAYRIYNERPRSINQESNGRLVSKRSFKISIVPMVAGEIKLAPLRLAYFDPATLDYHVVEATIAPFTALPNPSAAALLTSVPAAVTPAATNVMPQSPQPTNEINVDNAPDEPSAALFSTAAIALGFSCLTLILVTVWMLKRCLHHNPRVLDARSKISQAGSVAELSEIFSENVARQLGLAPNYTTPDALRFAVSKLDLSAHLSHQILSTLDSLSLSLNQVAPPEIDDFARLKEESQLALSALSRRRA